MRALGEIIRDRMGDRRRRRPVSKVSGLDPSGKELCENQEMNWDALEAKRIIVVTLILTAKQHPRFVGCLFCGKSGYIITYVL